MSARYHSSCRLLGNQEATKSGHSNRLRDRVRIKFRNRTVRARTGIVDDKVRLAETMINLLEECRDGTHRGRINRERGRANLGGERFEFADVSRRETDFDAESGEAAGQ